MVELRVVETTERPHRPLYTSSRRFGYVQVGRSGDESEPQFIRAAIVNGLAKLSADAVVTVTLDEEIR